jgi:multidrug efflux pump subunit AcrB
VVITCVVGLVLALWGFRKVDQSFFPPATQPQFRVDVDDAGKSFAPRCWSCKLAATA